MDVIKLRPWRTENFKRHFGLISIHLSWVPPQHASPAIWKVFWEIDRSLLQHLVAVLASGKLVMHNVNEKNPGKEQIIPKPNYTCCIFAFDVFVVCSSQHKKKSKSKGRCQHTHKIGHFFALNHWFQRSTTLDTYPNKKLNSTSVSSTNPFKELLISNLDKLL